MHVKILKIKKLFQVIQISPYQVSKSLVSRLESMENYQIVPVDTFEPTEMSDRRQWRLRLENILPLTVLPFSISFGIYVGNALFVWKVLHSSEIGAEEELEVVTKIKYKMRVFYQSYQKGVF